MTNEFIASRMLLVAGLGVALATIGCAGSGNETIAPGIERSELFALLAHNNIVPIEEEGAYTSRHELPSCRYRVMSSQSTDAFFLVFEEATSTKGYTLDQLYWYDDWSRDTLQEFKLRKRKVQPVEMVSAASLKRWVTTGVR